MDPTKDAAKLDEKYAELTAENVPELHELIKPFFLRRTKAEVLTTLPPMAQVIIPVTMSFLQKKVYKSILEKNLDLIKTYVFFLSSTRLDKIMMRFCLKVANSLFV